MGNVRVQVLPEQGDWKVAVDGKDRGERFPTQAEAEEHGRRIAQEMDGEFQLHASTGNIREKDSYGRDPSDIPG